MARAVVHFLSDFPAETLLNVNLPAIAPAVPLATIIKGGVVPSTILSMPSCGPPTGSPPTA